jgi:hypothetical protein
MADGRKVRALQGSVAGNARLRPQGDGRIRATETSPRLIDGGVKRGNLYAEQGQIGGERRPVSLLSLGWLLDPTSNGWTRQMIITHQRRDVFPPEAETEPGLQIYPGEGPD